MLLNPYRKKLFSDKYQKALFAAACKLPKFSPKIWLHNKTFLWKRSYWLFYVILIQIGYICMLTFLLVRYWVGSVVDSSISDFFFWVFPNIENLSTHTIENSIPTIWNWNNFHFMSYLFFYSLIQNKKEFHMHWISY